MKVMVAGASGFIGSALCPFLRKRGHEVAVLRRNSSQWDPDRGVIDASLLEGYDAVINLSGENILTHRWTDEKKRRILESRIKSTRLLADALAFLPSKPKVFLNASAIGFYGDRGDDVVREGSRQGEGFLAEVCRQWEASTAAAKNGGIRTVLLRTGVVLGKGGGALGRALLPFKMGLGGVIGQGSQSMSWIAMDDFLEAVEFLLTHPAIEGAVNLTSPNPVTNYAFTKALGAVLGRPTFCSVPEFAVKALYGRECAEETLLSSIRAEPARLLEAGFSFRYPQLEKALEHELRGDD